MATETPTITTRTSARILAVVFTIAGSLHFIRPATYEAIMPPYVPLHRELVYASGAAEIAGGIAALFPQLHPLARWWLIALLIAVFPANLQMALNPGDIKGLPHSIPTWALWLRLPGQIAFIFWVVRATRPQD